jgi:hypothetical protein
MWRLKHALAAEKMLSPFGRPVAKKGQAHLPHCGLLNLTFFALWSAAGVSR